MLDHGRAGLHRRVEDHYEQYESDGYDEYEEVEASEGEDDEEQLEDSKPTKEEQEFLKLREQLKEKARQKLKKESANTFGRSSQSQDRSKTVTNDKFGSFFGPSQPSIAARVLVESRSIRETQHIVAKVPNSSASQNKKTPVSTPTVKKTHEHDQRPLHVKNVNEVKNKAKTLKDMRDYSFLLSDDADLPDPVKEEPAPRKVPVQNTGNAPRPASVNQRSEPRKPSAPSSDGRSVKAPLKSKTPMSKSARPVDNGHEKKNFVSASQHVQTKVGSKESPMYRSKSTSGEARKGSGAVGREAAPQKVAMRPPAKIMNNPSGNKKPLSAKPNSSTQNHYSDQRRVTQGPGKPKAAPKQPPPSAKNQPIKPSKQIPAPRIHEERPKKRPLRRDHDDDEGDDAIQAIRRMFGCVFTNLLPHTVMPFFMLWFWFGLLRGIEVGLWLGDQDLGIREPDRPDMLDRMYRGWMTRIWVCQVYLGRSNPSASIVLICYSILPASVDPLRNWLSCRPQKPLCVQAGSAGIRILELHRLILIGIGHSLVPCFEILRPYCSMALLCSLI